MRVGAIERDGDNNRRVISCVYGEKYDVERLHPRSFGGVVQKDDMRMGHPVPVIKDGVPFFSCLLFQGRARSPARPRDQRVRVAPAAI